MKTYDIIVIGSGGGSKITSPSANQLGLKVACIEKDALGGTCLNRGCIPSKMLIHPADIVDEIKSAHKHEINVSSDITVNFEKLIKHISNSVDGDSEKIVGGYTKNPNIDYYKGTARFVSNNVIDVNGEQITAPKIIISVGTRPHIPQIEGLKGTPYMTSTEALRTTTLPKKMIVIGAGYIGVELGHAYGALGCDVHFMVRSKFLRAEDSQVAEEFTNAFSKKYNVHMGATPTKISYENSQFVMEYQTKKDDKPQTISADALLVATGIVSNTDTLSLENTDIKTDAKGFVPVNDYLETAVAGVYAIGDCIGRYLFRHSVNFEGEYLFETAFKKTHHDPIKYPPIPHAVFSNPQIAGVGKTEDELIKEKADYVVGLNLYKNSAMGMALRSEYGFCKILIDRKTRLILGAHIVGAEASNMVHMLIAFMTKNGTLDDLLNMIYIHPALPEIVRNAARKAQIQWDKNPYIPENQETSQTLEF